MDINWHIKKFEELSNEELYSLLQLRSQVFVVEQNCAYLDADDKDLLAHHLFATTIETKMLKPKLIAYARLLPPGISYPQASIGRVVAAIDERKKGLGKFLMQKSIDQTLLLFGNNAIKISAQLYLKNFYESLGFVTIGKDYLEDDIPHIAMIYNPAKQEI